MKYTENKIKSIFIYPEKEYMQGTLMKQYIIKGYRELFTYDLNFELEKGDKFKPSNNKEIYKIIDVIYDENGSKNYIVDCDDIEIKELIDKTFGDCIKKYCAKDSD